MSVNSTTETVKDPLLANHPQFKQEDNCFYSRWLYGNHTAYLVTSLRNSNLAQKAYSPDGEVQSPGYRALYGISLVASTFFGIVLDVIHNFLAIASVYFLGKRIWEYSNNAGPFAPIKTTEQEMPDVRITIKNRISNGQSGIDSGADCSERVDNNREIYIPLDPIRRTPHPPLPDTSKPFNIHR